MSQDLDYRQHLVLFVDDEPKTRKYFAKLFGKTFRVVLAEDGVAGLDRFREYQDEVGVVITDQRMPNETGTQFLEKVSLLKPNSVRILSTAFSDLDAAVEAVNKGGIYRYITKPWEIVELEVTLKRAMELYTVRLEREELVRQKMLSVDILAASDRIISLAALAVFRESGLRHVGEALKAVVRLGEEPRGKTLSDAISAEGLSWRELYRRHLSFLGSVNANLPADLGEPQSLDFTERCSVREVVDPSVEASGGTLAWAEARATPPDWPGPLADIQAVLAPFLGSLSQAVGTEGTIQLEECLSGLEILLPGDSVRRVLQPAMSSSAEEPPRLAMELIGSFLRVSHHGGVLDFLPEPREAETRFRLGFDVSRVERAPQDPYEELAADLVGNELFWSRFLE